MSKPIEKQWTNQPGRGPIGPRLSYVRAYDYRRKIELTVGVIALMAVGLLMACAIYRIPLESKYKVEAWILYAVTVLIFVLTVTYRIFT